MSILGVSDVMAGACQYTGRTQKNTVNGASFIKRTAQTQEVSDAEKFENFKKEIWNEINSMPWGANTSIQITDGAFRKMMEDSEFKNKMMKIIREDAIGSNKMCGGTLINIDENGYKGYSYMADHAKEAESAFSAHSKDKDSFYVKKAEKKREYRKLLEEKRLKQELAEKDLKVALERKRLTENAIERKRESGRIPQNVSVEANAAYEANFLMADSGSI